MDTVYKHWQNPENWKFWGYYCKEDPRFVVPKQKPNYGMTLNYAHPQTLVAVLLLLTLPLTIPRLVSFFETDPNPMDFFYSIILVFVAVCAICFYLLRKSRI